MPGVEPARIAVLGGGVVGTNAAKVAAGFGAAVTILDINVDRLRYLDDIMPRNVNTLFSDRHTIREQLADPGGRHPALTPFRCHIIDDVDGETVLRAHPLQQRRIARTPSPEAEVAPDEDHAAARASESFMCSRSYNIGKSYGIMVACESFSSH